jgi:Type IV pilin-like G and H, putative
LGGTSVLKHLRFLAAGLLTFGLILNFGGRITPAIAQSSLTIAGIPASAEKTIAEKLLGYWEVEDPESGEKLGFIFTPKGKLFLILPPEHGQKNAIEMDYKINPTAKPMEMDVQINGDAPALTIFELTEEGKLRLEIDGVAPKKPRPEKFSDLASLLHKISEETKLPEDVELIVLDNPTKSGQKVVLQYIKIINQAQEEYFQKQGKFAADIEELGIVTNLETENYRYQIVPQGDRTQSTMLTGTAKNADFPSYTSALIVTSIKGKNQVVAITCQTDQPSMTPPTMPIVSESDRTQFECPAGSHLLP